MNEELSFPDHVNLSNEIQDLLYRLLCKNPQYRLGSQHGIKEILSHPWFKGMKPKDIMEKKLEPPYRPNPIGYNFDEEEFLKGDNEFRKQF